MYQDIVSNLANKCGVPKKGRKKKSLSSQVLSLVQEANSNAPVERHVVPRAALTVMNRAQKELSALSGESKDLGVLREVAKFITAHQDTHKAHEYSVNTDLLPVGHPKSLKNLSATSEIVRERYAQWLASDSSIHTSIKSLVAAAHSLEPGSLERQHAFTRLSVAKSANIPAFFKIDAIPALVAAFSFSGGNSSAARRARVALQWRDRKGRWIEMGRGIDFNFRLRNGDIGSAGGTYVGVNAERGYSTENGKPVANAGLVEIRGHDTLPDGIYSIESANATPVKARVPGRALKKAGVERQPGTRKPTSEQSLSKDIPNIDDLLKTRVDAPSGWAKQDDNSFISDDDYKLIPNESGFALHRLDKDGNTGDKVGDVASWAEAQDLAEKDSPEYDKFKESVGIKKTQDAETEEGINAARNAQEERRQVIARLDAEDEETESSEEAPADRTKTLIPEGVEKSGTLPNGVEYSVEDVRQRVQVFPGRFGETNGVRVTLDGNTYENRKRIKQLGFKWNNQDKVWIKNYVDTDLLGKDRNAKRIKAELDGIGGGVMPRYERDNEEVRNYLQEALNSITLLSREDDSPAVTDAKAILWEAMEKLRKAEPNDRKLAQDDLKTFISALDAEDFPKGQRANKAKAIAMQGIDLIDASERERGVVPQEAPEAPKGDNEVVAKTPSDVTPTSPKLFEEFDTPEGAFRLRTVDYEPEGRIDEESTDFTDDPERLATKYALPELTAALTQALIGDKDNNVIAQIVDSSIGEDDESLDLEGVEEVVNTPVSSAGRANGTGAGQLEFNKGSEFVPAEALYNAVFLAGGDPNRVIANAYDAINGNRNNLNKLHDAAGGVPDAEDAQLIDDIFEQINQIKDASTPEELKQKGANLIDGVEEEAPLPGELIYNIPGNFDNPDYYDIDPNPYPPMRKEPDEFGFTDDPEYIARNFAEADLLEQFEASIVDGSGTVYLIYNSDVPISEGMYEVPIEAVRDALQLQGVNTNDVLERIRTESNDFDEEPTPEPTPEETPQPEQTIVSYSGAIDGIKEFFDVEDDPTFPDGIDIIAYLPSDGSLAFIDPWEDVYVAYANGGVVQVNVGADWFTDPQGAGQAGWRKITPEERSDIYETGSAPEEEPTSEPTPEPTPESTPPAPEAPAAPQYQYPGPKEAGYSPNNTTLVLGGAVVGKDARVQATKDGKLGTVVAIQNDPEYLRIRFDDGTTAVRSATKVRAISTPAGQAPQVVTREEMPPSQDVRERLNRPLVPTPRLARSGETLGVNDESTRPEILQGKTKEGVTQLDFSAWGLRDAEIAKAASDRVSLEVLEQEAYKRYLAIVNKDNLAAREASDNIKALMGDAYGDRTGMSFGGEFYTMRVKEVNPMVYLKDGAGLPTEEDIKNGKASVTFEIGLDILDVSGNVIGRATRSVRIERKFDPTKNATVTKKTAYAQYLVISDGKKKQKGFGSAYNRWVENWYIANGVEKIKVAAAGGGQFQGGFVWALNGYNWEDSDEARGILRQLRRRVSNSLEETQVENLGSRFEAAARPDGSYDMSLIPTPLEFALVGWDPEKDQEKGTWLGRKVMVENSWSGGKNLVPTAREQIQAVNYNQIRSARGRVLSKQNIPNVSSEGLAAIESNEFRNNLTIAPYYSQIRDALRNNRSLAVLSPDAKNALNDYVSQQMLLGPANAKLSLDDVFRLRSGLINEYRADYGYSDPFNSAEVLATFKLEDYIDATTRPEGAKLTEAGFTVRGLTIAESGVNATFEVIHVPSGQVFYVKNDLFMSDFSDTPAGVVELEASTLLRAAGMQGVHDVRVGRNTGRNDRNLVVMSRAGSTIPLQKEAVNASNAINYGIKDTQGNTKTFYSPEDFLNALDNPEDLIRMSILDILGGNEDRHNGNWMMAYDKATGKLRIFPVDNTVGEIKVDKDSMADYINYGSFMEADVYIDYMPTLIARIGSDGMMKIYENEINNIIKNLDNPLYQPRSFEMDKIIEKWGSYDAFKDATASRLKKLITKDTEEYNALKNALRIGYWN